MPDCLEGKVVPADILDKVREKYQELYNSATTEVEMIGIKERLKTVLRLNDVIEANKITAEVVKSACFRMKNGKVDVSGSYSSDVFIHAPDVLYERLAIIFRSFMVHGTLTKEILHCAFLPLFKGGFKSPEKFDSY